MLPFLNNSKNRAKKQVVSFRGINYSDSFQDGDMRECLNISARRYPYIATRRARRQLPEYSGATAMTSRGGLVVVRGTDLVYEGKVVGQVSAGEKQFAVVNTKLIIWPDKKYLDLTTKTLVNMGVSASGTGVSFSSALGDVTVSDTWPDLTTLFKIGDGVTISGSKNPENNKSFVVKGVAPKLLSFGENTVEDSTESGTITLERKVPDLDFIFEAENRLWGCSNADQTIYVSAWGSPENFFAYGGTDNDSYAVAVGSDGDFTGCCKYSSSYLFWKENKLHKMLGSYPSEYTLYSYDIEGLQQGSNKSLQVINEVLYYLGTHGVYAYTGSMPSLISANFGEKLFSDGVSGNDGDTYYLSAKDGETYNLLVYETRSGQWMREDATNAVDFARMGTDLYMLDGTGNVWLMDSKQEDPELEWMVRFTPFYESVEGRKMFSKLLLRAELPRGSWMKIETRCDEGRWKPAGKIIGRDVDTVPIRLPLNRCDVFELRLSGVGQCTIKSMLLEYVMGSDV